MPDLPVSLGALGDILGFNIRLAHAAVLRHFAERFADLTLTQKQVSVLWLTRDHPGIAQTNLAHALAMDRATTMTIVHALEKRGLLHRDRHAGDARRVALTLTRAGDALFTEAKMAIVEHEAWLADRFTPEERTMLIEMLRRIHR